MSTPNPDGSLDVPARPAWPAADIARLRELRLADGWSEERIAEEAAIMRQPLEAHHISAPTMEKLREMWRNVS